MKVVLTIAGTDPSGAAGIQADLQVMRDHGVHGVSVITAVLAQNTQGVQVVEPMPVDLVQAQLDAVFDDFDIAAIKVGLVPDDQLLAVVTRVVGRAPLVWDPVLASGDGHTPLFTGATRGMLEAMTEAAVITPNVPEAAALSGMKVETPDDAHRAAAALSSHGPAVLLKVGHLEHGETLRDVWAFDGESWDMQARSVVPWDVRGTGCQLSSAIACHLATGEGRIVAAEQARRYLNELLTDHALSLGRGRRLVVRGRSSQ